jgi:ATP-dependent DNA helicase UvrD/PcrA
MAYYKRPYSSRPRPTVDMSSQRQPQKPAYPPSPLQQVILDWLTTSNGNAIIEARAGTGKTSTLVMLANEIPTSASATFLAFNKSIASELSAKLPSHVSASTFHALAFRAVGRALSSRNNGCRVNVDANKCGNIFDALYGRDAIGARSAVLKLVSLMKASALLPGDAPDAILDDIIGHFDIEWDDDTIRQQDVCAMARETLAASNDDTLTVDFDDMLYFVVVYGVRLDTFDYVMVDEAQDTNKVQRVILRRLLRPDSRLIAVGDPAQAIYGFRGASHDSMDLIREEFSCTVLPLNVSYRCPSSVITLAQRYVPDIEARPNAPEGTVLYPDTWKLAQFEPTDLLVCRNTAPLVQVAYRLLAARIPAKIMGREIGKGLTSLITKVAGKRTTLDELPAKLLDYQEREVSRAMARKQEGKAQAVADKCEAILALIDSMTPVDRNRGVAGLVAIIDNMFSDNGGTMTTLATVHKAKGLEAPRVFILDPQRMPSKYARQPWQVQQEQNLIYVAITRALDTLVYLNVEHIAQ